MIYFLFNLFTLQVTWRRACSWPCFVMVLILAPDLGMALDPSKSIYQYNSRSWTKQNGLPANAINAITQTKDGYLWLATSAGIVRFDGCEFMLFDVSLATNSRSSIVTGLCQSRRGGLWFGTEHGSFGYFDGKNSTLLGRDAYGGKNLDVRSVLETGDGTLWITSEILAARLTTNQEFDLVLNTTNMAARFDVSALYQDPKNRVWLGTVQHGLYCWEKGVVTKFSDPVLDTLTIRCLVEDHEGQLWVGTDMGLFCFDSQLRRKPFPFPWYATRALLVDQRGTLWAGTSGGGLIRFLNGTPVELRQLDGLADDFVTALAEDDEGSLWVGTRNGLSQISDIKLPTFGKAEGLVASVNVSVSNSRSNGLWVAASDGYAYFDGTAHVFTNDIGLQNHYVVRVFEARSGCLYLVDGSKNISVIVDGRIVTSYANKLWPSAMTEDDQSVIVTVGTNFFRVGTNFFKPYEFKNGLAPPIRWTFTMARARDGSILVADDVGILRIKNGAWQMWTTEQGLGNSKVRWICEDDDNVVWAGMETGIARLKDGKLRNITRDDGLFDNIINAIVPDDYGSLWVDSSRGFFRVSRQATNDFADGKTTQVKCESFDGLDAVKSADKFQQQICGCKTPDGRIWFPTSLGVVMIDPTNITANTVPPKVHLQNVRANGREVDPYDLAVVRPGNGELEFRYAGVGFLAPLKIEYRYKLEGYDLGWVAAGGRRSAFYTNLKPGKYTFQVQARYKDDEWNLSAARAHLELTPYFYQTFWFLISLSLGILAVIFSIYVWRVRRFRGRQIQLQRARDQLEAKVIERTSELAASNLSLKNEVEERKHAQAMAGRLQQELLESSRRAGMAEIATNVLHNVGNVLNSVNVSTGVVIGTVSRSKVSSLARVATLLQAHAADPGKFMADDPRGQRLPKYLDDLSTHLQADQAATLKELDLLRDNIGHIKEIVAMQQSYAKVSGIREPVAARDLVEDSLRMDLGSLGHAGVEIIREFASVPLLNVERHKVLQILVNVVRNAKHACVDSRRPDKQIIVRITGGDGRVRIDVADNGVGIPPENLNRIFNHGFTTRANGHGFGLHSGALAAREMGGSLTVQSEGSGKGSSFTLDLPCE